MLTHYHWLFSLPFIASAISHAYPPIGLKPRYLTTGTGVSSPSTSAPPYPTGTGTGTANGTAIPTGSTPTSTATPTSTSSPELFFLVVADSGTDMDGSYLEFSAAVAYSGAILLYPHAPPLVPDPAVLFNINEDNTLHIPEFDFVCWIFGGNTWAGVRVSDDFDLDDDPYDNPYNVSKLACEVVGGELACETGGRTVFSICPDTSVQVVVSGFTGGSLDIGPTVEPGCSEVSLLIVPA